MVSTARPASDVKMVTGKINGQDVTVPAGTYILEAARLAGIEVPNLCFQPLLRPWGSCRICTVEILGKRGGLIESCATPLGEGMEVLTHSPELHRGPPVHPPDVPDRPRARLPDLRQVGRVLPAGQHLPAQRQRQPLPPAEVRPALRALQRADRLQVGPVHHVQPVHPRLRRGDRRHRHRVGQPRSLEATIAPAFGHGPDARRPAPTAACASRSARSAP